VAIKIILDHPQLQPQLQQSYGIPNGAFFLIPSDKVTRGIEDVFSAGDFQRLLTGAGITASMDELQYGNSTFAKTLRLDKRYIAQEFFKNIASFRFDEFDVATRDNITALLAFCANDHWFTVA
jgi:hypothetical protein